MVFGNLKEHNGRFTTFYINNTKCSKKHIVKLKYVRYEEFWRIICVKMLWQKEGLQ